MLIFLIYFATISFISTVKGSNVVGSSCTIMNKKLVITGGTELTNTLKTEFNKLIFVDLTQPFNTQTLDLSNSPAITKSLLPTGFPVLQDGAIFGESAIGSKLWMYGGKNKEGSPMNESLRYFDLNTGNYSSKIKTNSPPTRSSFAWIFYNETLRIYGGELENGNPSGEHWEFKLKEQRWQKLVTTNDLPSLKYHQGVLLKGRFFVIMGGLDSDGDVRNLSLVYIYDLQLKTWDHKTITNGDSHPIVKFKPIAYKDKIYILGGANMLNTTHPGYQFYNGIMVLDTNIWAWKHYDFGEFGQLNLRTDYTAALVGNQLVQVFGVADKYVMKNAKETFHHIQVIDLDKLAPSNDYIPPNNDWYIKASSGQIEEEQSNNNLYIIIGVISGVVALLVIGGIIYLFYRKKVNKLQKQVEEIKPFPDVKPELNPIWISSEAIDGRVIRPDFCKTSDTLIDSKQFTHGYYVKKTNVSSNNTASDSQYTLPTSPSSGATNPLPQSSNEIFSLMSQTVLPGETREEAINAKFVS